MSQENSGPILTPSAAELATMPIERAATFLVQAPVSIAAHLVASIPTDRAGERLKALPPQRAADLLDSIDEDHAAELLQRIGRSPIDDLEAGGRALWPMLPVLPPSKLREILLRARRNNNDYAASLLRRTNPVPAARVVELLGPSTAAELLQLTNFMQSQVWNEKERSFGPVAGLYWGMMSGMKEAAAILANVREDCLAGVMGCSDCNVVAVMLREAGGQYIDAICRNAPPPLLAKIFMARNVHDDRHHGRGMPIVGANEAAAVMSAMPVEKSVWGPASHAARLGPSYRAGHDRVGSRACEGNAG